MLIIDLSFLLLDRTDQAKPTPAPISITALYLPPSIFNRPQHAEQVIASSSNTEQAAIENWFAPNAQIDEIELKPSESSVMDTTSIRAEKNEYLNEQAYAHNNHEPHALEP